MSKYKRLLSNTVILGAGTFASKVLVFLLMPLYTSILSTAEYGVADIITQTANLLMPLAAVGICDALFRFVLDTADTNGENDRRRIFSSGMLVILIGSAALIGAVQMLHIFDVFEGYVWLVAAYVICANLHSAAANFLRAIGKTGLFAIQGIINTVLTIALNVLFLVAFDMGALGYVLSVVIADLCMTVFVFFFARLDRFLSPSAVDGATIRAMMKYSSPYIPSTLMWFITSVSDRYIVVYYAGATENGLYAAAYKLPTLLLLVCGVFIEAWQFSVVKDADEEQRSKFFSDVFKNYSGIIFMGATMLIAGSRIFTRLLLADSYYSSWRFVPMLVIAMTFSVLVSFLGSVYFLEKKSVMSMVTAMAGAAINIVLNFWLIPKRGAMGAAVATMISYAAVYAIRAYDTRFYFKFNMHTARVVANALILLAQAVMMIGSFRYLYYTQGLFVVAILIINGREIVVGVCMLCKKILKKGK